MAKQGEYLDYYALWRQVQAENEQLRAEAKERGAQLYQARAERDAAHAQLREVGRIECQLAEHRDLLRDSKSLVDTDDNHTCPERSWSGATPDTPRMQCEACALLQRIEAELGEERGG